jgi:hypothetical protein
MKTLGSHPKFLQTMLPALFAMTFFSASAQAPDSAQAPKLLPDTSEVRLTVRDTAGAPIRNARVEMLVLSRGHDQGSMEVRTDDNGTIEQDIIPIGDVVRMEISAPGFQAMGVNYPVNNLVKQIVVRLRQQPVIETAANDQPAALIQSAPAANTSSASTYIEAQWVTKRAHSAARKPHAPVTSVKKSDPSKNEVAAAQQPAIQK